MALFEIQMSEFSVFWEKFSREKKKLLTNKNSQFLYVSVYTVTCIYVSNDFLNLGVVLPHLGCHTSKI